MILPTQPPPGEAKEKPQTVLQHRLRKTIHCLAQDRKAHCMNSNLPERIQLGSVHQPEYRLWKSDRGGHSSSSNDDQCSVLKKWRGGEVLFFGNGPEVAYEDLFGPPALDVTEATEGRKEPKCPRAPGAHSSAESTLSLDEVKYQGEHPFDYSIGSERPSRSDGGDAQ